MLAVAPQMKWCCQDPVDGVQVIGSGNGERDMVAWIQQVVERHFESLVDLVPAQGELIVGSDQPQHRQHVVLGDGVEGREGTQHLYLGRDYAELFLGFPQRRVDQVPVVRILSAAGEAYLPCVVAQVRAAPGQQQLQAVGPLDQR